MLCVYACMCCLVIQVAVYILLVWVSGYVSCVRWVVYVVVSYACPMRGVCVYACCI